MVCKNCGSNSGLNSKYCANCGSNLEEQKYTSESMDSRVINNLSNEYERENSNRGEHMGNYKQMPNKFNWGAFLFPIPWGIGCKTYLALLCLIPIFNIIWIFVCGFNGNKWAWENGNYRDMEEFSKVQETWNRAGLVFFILTIIPIGIILLNISLITALFLGRF